MSRHIFKPRATDKRGNSIAGVVYSAYHYDVDADWFSIVNGEYIIDHTKQPAAIPYFESSKRSNTDTLASLVSGEDGYPTTPAYVDTGDYTMVGVVPLEGGGTRAFIVARYSAGVTEQAPFTGVIDFRYPDDWEWRPPGLQIWKSGERWYCDEQEYVSRFFAPGILSSQDPDSVVWIATDGSDLAPGTFTEPKASIAGALATNKPNIKVMPGSYYNSFGEVVLTQDTSITAPDGPARFIAGLSGHMVLWSDLTGGVFRATTTDDFTQALCELYDETLLDERGYPQRLERAADLAECASTPGTWFPSDATTIHVHRYSDAEPDEDILMLPALDGARSAQQHSLYLNNITTLGGTTGGFWYRTESDEKLLYAIRCQFLASHQFGGLRIQGAHAVQRDCSAGMNIQDGLNYHDLNDIKCHIIEIDSVSHVPTYAGHNDTVVNQNASTGHDENRIIRVGGVYSGARADVITDVNDAASLNMGIQSISRSDDQAAFKADVINGTSYVIDGRLEGDVSVIEGTNGKLVLDENTKVTGAVEGSPEIINLADMTTDNTAKVSTLAIPRLPNNGPSAVTAAQEFAAWLAAYTVVAELDARKIGSVPADGATVTQWDNGGTSATVFTATGNVIYRSYLAGYGGPVLDLSAGSWLTSSGWTQAQPSLTIIVGQYGTDLGDPRMFSNASDANSRQEFYIQNSINKYRGFSGSSLTTALTADLSAHTWGVQFNDASSGLWIDGVKASGTIGDGGTDGLRIGADSDEGRASSPIIAYAAVVTGLVDDADIEQGLALAAAYVASLP